MKTKVAWRCQEIFFLLNGLYISKASDTFFHGVQVGNSFTTLPPQMNQGIVTTNTEVFLQQSNNKCKKWIFPINFALLLFFSGCIELIEIKGPDHVQRELGWPFKSKCFFHNLLFFAQSTWSGPLYNPKELQLTLSTYILKSGKTNYKLCLGTKPALMDCLLNVLS